MSLQEKLKRVFADAAGVAPDQVQVEVPPDPTLGDFAFPCFSLAKQHKKAPGQISSDLAGKLSSPLVRSAKAAGPYVNVFVTVQALADALTLSPALQTPETILVESPSPNTNKPLHLGHVRNMLLGNAVTALLRKRGHKALRMDIVNDRGVHICKSMLAYERWGGGETPASTNMKSDHFCGHYYVVFAKEAEKDATLESQAQEMLRAWEAGDPHVRALWEKMRAWCLEGFAQTYKDFAVHIDQAHYESDIYQLGKDVVREGLERGIFKKDEKGAVYADVPGGQKFVQRADGTSIYITQDLALAKIRFAQFHMDRLVYVVGNEQNHHFTSLFSIFSQLGYTFAARCYHLSYGMISLPEGKMKSREGTVVDADDLRAKMIELAAEEVARRFPDLSVSELEHRAQAIGMGALVFYVLKFDPSKDFVYDPKESISFTGDTGPYVMYTYARISSIFRKGAVQAILGADASVLEHDLERQLLAKLVQYPSVVASAADQYRPSSLAQYLLELARLTNAYYHDVHVLVPNENLKFARAWLLTQVQQVLADGLGLLGVSVLDEM